ncbi:hypothetical protein [Rossellomorea vietnamensis]|uniref:hypothetical protein n=1 Tax=Rossellomorea vietnamensis TaxID=218284 RepID=UPI0016537363|nr:hypothetical protein [Rossellomorea vietnamensis]
MNTGRILLLAVLAGIYSAILNEAEESISLGRHLSITLLILGVFLTGVLLHKIGK